MKKVRLCKRVLPILLFVVLINTVIYYNKLEKEIYKDENDGIRTFTSRISELPFSMASVSRRPDEHANGAADLAEASQVVERQLSPVLVTSATTRSGLKASYSPHAQARKSYSPIIPVELNFSLNHQENMKLKESTKYPPPTGVNNLKEKRVVLQRDAKYKKDKLANSFNRTETSPNHAKEFKKLKPSLANASHADELNGKREQALEKTRESLTSERVDVFKQPNSSNYHTFRDDFREQLGMKRKEHVKERLSRVNEMAKLRASSRYKRERFEDTVQKNSILFNKTGKLFPNRNYPSGINLSVSNGLLPSKVQFVDGFPSTWTDERRVHTIKNVLESFKAMLPNDFLPQFKNPCWYWGFDKSVKNGTIPWSSLTSLKIAKEYFAKIKGSTDNGKSLQCLPYFYIMGYSKCGTTTLWKLLSLHPDYKMPMGKEAAILSKTQHFKKFVPPFPGIPKTVMDYMDYFAPAVFSIYLDKNHSVTGDCSADVVWELPFQMNLTLTYEGAMPFLLSQILPQTKFIVILRDPVKRLVSDFYSLTSYFCKKEKKHLAPSAELLDSALKMHITAFSDCLADKHDEIYCMYMYKNWLKSTRKVPSCVNIRLAANLYYYSLVQWYKYFPTNQILVLLSSDLEEDPAGIALQMYKFLGFSPPSRELVEKLELSTGFKANANHELPLFERHFGPLISNVSFNAALQFFKPHNRKLAELIGNPKFAWT